MAGLEKAAALRQAASVRRALLREAARELSGDLDDETREMVHAWVHSDPKDTAARRKSYGPHSLADQPEPSTRVSYWV